MRARMLSSLARMLCARKEVVMELDFEIDVVRENTELLPYANIM